MAKTQAVKESIELTHDQMDIIFSALEKVEKEGEAIIAKAAGMKSEDAAMAQTRYNKGVEDLKQMFLHE